ncbi:MAG: membrane integrity-associated transporter subunit PqiC [Alphaproteobacteria bacterium]|nr:membrane integrity-associated transporter subunit PqiC [Alphaproteobacteria bacterium]MBU1516976.1 membrane integrity-associated transporter subunit PqiC [Alphaproteobacteria bacterium]MBU2095864.1 membrane integrity-associated transporter subunit PqiC [Alphaproteobacteria bacterium]MBU2151999.1 membrane integrity-associated transporter subunit PqiC [Alphaproteobacteria bacterium]MBU2309520.1 membrane integrity-associated transporter subunit PqiC [Alphaproteobacteria bacterium]
MMRSSALLRLLAVGASALTLSACVSLLPKTKPAHLYRFGQPVAAEAVNAAVGGVGVLRTTAVFQREAAGDRLLTMTNGKAAYVAETRWVVPAAVLWDEAVVAAFDADAGPVRLVARGEPAPTPYVLRLDVRNFETQYDNGPKAAPVIVVRVRAAMTSTTDRGVVGERLFEKRVRAGDNRVTAIVPAYDRAVGEVLAEVVAWTNANAKPKT